MRRTSVLIAALVLAAGPVRAADRLADKDVKLLLEQVDRDRDRFEDALDGKFKHGILRDADKEVDVGVFLDDLQANTGRLKDRYTDKYAASNEVTTVLRQGAIVDQYIAQQAPDFKGSSEWLKLRGSLATLAEVYGATFPLTSGVSARRLNDAEVRQAAEALAQGADRYKKALEQSLKADPAIAQATRDAVVHEADNLTKDAKTLASRLGDGKPASGEARQLFDRLGRVQASAVGLKLLPPAQEAWASITAVVAPIAQGFGLPVPR